MGIIIKSSIRFSAIMYIGVLIGSINTIFIFPNILSEEEFGLTRILMSASAVISQFALLGTGNILVRFHPYFKDDKQNTTLSIGFVISTLGLVLSWLFLLLFKPVVINQYEENSRLFTAYYYLIIPFVSSMVFFSLFDSYLRVIIKNSVPAFLNFILLRLLWLGLVIIYSFGLFSLTTFINIYVACHATIAALAFAYTVYLGKLKITFRFGFEKISIIRKMMGFGIFTIISGFSLFLINRIDILMIGKYLSLEQVAVYTIAFYISTVITIPAQSISRASGVLVADSFKKNNIKNIEDIYKMSAVNQLMLGGYVYIMLLINYNNIISFLPSAYHNSFEVFLLLGLAKVIETGLGITGTIILNSKYYKFDTYTSLILVVITVLTNIIFIPQFGIFGASLATAISVVIFSVIKVAFLRVKMDMNPFNKNYFLGIVILTISFAIPAFIPAGKFVLADMLFRAVTLSVIYILFVYFFNISPQINNLIRDSLLKINIKI